MNREKEKLYRKYNKTAMGFHNMRPGGNFRHERNTKKLKEFEGTHRSIKKTQAGFDYTPLFKFLLSKIGCKWNDVHSEAISRLDKEEPIFWMVKLNPEPSDRGYMIVGESSYYSILTVDHDGILIKLKPDVELPKYRCTCCTHTFNGKVIKKI